MNTRSLLITLFFIPAYPWIASNAALPSWAPPAPIFEEAERLAEENSWAKALTAFQEIDSTGLDTTDTAWLKFRLQDMTWRNQLSSQQNDNSKAEVAVRELTHMVRDVVKPENKGRLYAEIRESLADFQVHRNPRHPNPQSGWSDYRQALDTWAMSTDMDLARNRFIGIIQKAAIPANAPRHYFYGYNGQFIDESYIDQGLRIAKSTHEKGLLNYLKVKYGLRRHNPQGSQTFATRIEEAVAQSAGSEWEDDMLWTAAQFWEQQGVYVSNEKGQWTHQRDYSKSIKHYKSIRDRYKKEESRWWDDAGRRIEQIVKPALTLRVANVFSPQTLPQFTSQARNVEEVQLTFYRIDLKRDVLLAPDANVWDWKQKIRVAQRTPSLQQTLSVAVDQAHAPFNKTTTLDTPLQPGAYLIVAKANNIEAREILLVSDTVMLTKQLEPRKHLVWVTDAVTGEPKPGHTVSMHWRMRSQNRNQWSKTQGVSDQDGLVTLEIGMKDARSSQLLFTSSNPDGTEQAFCTHYNRDIHRPHDGYKFYVVTDRPAYRPGDTLKWKFTARQEVTERYQTPAGEKMGVTLRDQRGAELWKGTVTVNQFGSAWGEIPLTDKMALGLINMEIRRDNPTGKHLGNAQVCRLEEYKLPEFNVSVQTPKTDGKPKVFRTGETVEAEVQADYYYGEAVAGAEVHVIVRMKNHHSFWSPRRKFDWYYTDQMNSPNRWQQAQEVKRETLRTDDEGKAVIQIPTQNYGRKQMEFTIEARVVDSSRREVTGNGAVRVSPNSHSAHLELDHAIHAPGDRIKISVHTRDANQLPYNGKGRLTVFRRTWVEHWIDPQGQTCIGTALRKARSHVRTWPPQPPVGLPPWRLIKQGYEEEEVFSAELETGEDGDVDAAFKAKAKGYYHVYWKSATDPGDVVEARRDLWVAKPGSMFTGYHSGPVRLVVDKESFREGEKAMVMIHCDVPGRNVLLSRETNRVLDYEVIRMKDEAKVMRLDLTEADIPNMFLEVNAIANRQWHRETAEIIVPPEKHFLNVQVQYDQSRYQPGQTGTLTVTTTDLNDKPVATEVSLSALDESVLYIQKDLAGDPRKFFFGSKRTHHVQTRVGFHDKRYLHLPPKPTLPGFGVSPLPNDVSSLMDLRYKGKAGTGYGISGSLEFRENSMMDEMAAPSVSAPMKGKQVSLGRQDAHGFGHLAAGRSAGMEDKETRDTSGSTPNVVVRKDFRDTMAWLPDLLTDKKGVARTSVVFPDSLTTWNATARAASRDSQFGIGGTNVICTLPLVLRMQHPRFLIAGDTATLSANVHNRSEQADTYAVSVEADGLEMVDGDMTQRITLAAGAQARVDWTVSATQPGSVTLTMKAVGTRTADAMERVFEVVEHGMVRQLTETAKATGLVTEVFLHLPAERREGSTAVTVQVAPSLAVTMLDALPYLIRYPYGCVEQTMSRFMPAVMVRKTLSDQGLRIEELEGRMFGGVEKQHVGKTHKASEGLGALQSVTEKSLARLYDFQHDDGGWGWWKHGSSDDYMTAYVVWGLSLAQEADVSINRTVLDRGINYLRPHLVEHEENVNMQAWILHALVHGNADFGRVELKTVEHVFKQRNQLTGYARALLTLVLARLEDPRLPTLVANMENGVRKDEATDRSVLVHGGSTAGSTAPTIAWWGKDSGYRYWYEGGIEATAFSLMALLEADPDNALIDPAALWLIKNRRASNWNNTKDTAIAVLALNKYLAVRKELSATYDYTIKVNGQELTRGSISPETALSAASQFDVPEKFLLDEENRITVERSSSEGAVYLSSSASFFSLENPIPASGHEIFVKRQYFREHKIPTLLKGHVTEWKELHDGDSVNSGDRIEVVLTVESKNDLEYLLFEDRKPAGLESVQVKSGESAYFRQLKELVARARFAGEADPNLGQDTTGAASRVHQELRDRHIAVFADKLPQGFWEIRYTLRAETPGRFHALPVKAEAMYIPEIKGNSAEIRLNVAEQ